ncbi:hypothetical protein GCM10010232_18160 [Streptomyces amakusaensis]|uniref:Uncharacterized protein n=1 Tax=Streptomyces amakusaensis TaxID=67271 RepID=A0ABW0ASK8_9ACTN
MTPTLGTATIRVELSDPFDSRRNRPPGTTEDGEKIILDQAEHFFGLSSLLRPGNFPDRWSRGRSRHRPEMQKTPDQLGFLLVSEGGLELSTRAPAL